MSTSTPTQWGMELRPRIEQAKQARVFWGARVLATENHRDFELDMSAQEFIIQDDDVSDETKELIIRAMSVALESGGLIKAMKERVHQYRTGRLIPRKGVPIKHFRHGLKMLETGKAPRSTVVRLWADEEKPTMIAGGRKIHQIYEDEAIAAYGDTLGSGEHVHILLFIKQSGEGEPKWRLGEIAQHTNGSVIVLGHVVEDGQMFYNVFITHGKGADGRRVVRVPENSLTRDEEPES